MKKSLFAILLLASFSCEKEKTQPNPTTPVQGPTITKRFGYGLSGQPPGTVSMHDDKYQSVTSEIGYNEVYIHHHVPYKLEIGKKYLLTFQKNTGGPTGPMYEFRADVKFDESGAMTPINVYGNSAHWKDSILQDGESIIYFFIP